MGVEVLQPWSRAGDRRRAGRLALPHQRAHADAVDSVAACARRDRCARLVGGAAVGAPGRSAGRRAGRTCSRSRPTSAMRRSPTACCPCSRSTAAMAAWSSPTTAVTTVACCIRRDRLDACRRAAPGVRAGEVVEALSASAVPRRREALHRRRAVGPLARGRAAQPGHPRRARTTGRSASATRPARRTRSSAKA